MPDAETQVAEMFARIARQLLAEPDPDATLRRIASLAHQHLTGGEAVSVWLRTGSTLTTVAALGDLAAPLDQIQSDLGEGPCLDTLHDNEAVLSGDIHHERRWPRFALAARPIGVSSILAIRLFVDDRTLGALNVYSTTMNAFDEHAVAIGTIFATHAAIALTSSRHEDNLERKASSRESIGRAKGILMSVHNISDDEAFELLRHASQHLNRKLVDVAGEVGRTGHLPDEPRT